MKQCDSGSVNIVKELMHSNPLSAQVFFDGTPYSEFMGFQSAFMKFWPFLPFGF